MFKPDDKFLRAVINLQGNPDFEAVKAGLRRYWAILGGSFHAIEPDTLLRKIQGRSGLLSELLKYTDPQTARAELEVLEKKAKEANQKQVY